MSGTFWKPPRCYCASEVCMETEGTEVYQWRMCPAAGTGEVPVKAEQNRSSSVHFHSKNRAGETQRVQLVQLHPQSVSLKTSAPWIRHLIYPVAPSSSSSPPPVPPSHYPLLLPFSSGRTPSPHPSHPVSSPSLLRRPERGRFFKSLWLPWWFSIKPLWLKEPSDFLTGKKKLQIRINKQLWFFTLFLVR